MFATPGVEIGASVIIDDHVTIDHTVCGDGTVEMQIGGSRGLYLALNDTALQNLHDATKSALDAVEKAAQDVG